VSYSLVLPDLESLEAVLTHLRSRGLEVNEDAEPLKSYTGYVVNDQDGNAVELVARV
jgi:catechol 2,3-dioxygenase